MHIEQKQNKIYKPQSNTTLSAEESNQVTTEVENQIRAGGLTPSSSSLTQLRDSIKNVVDTAANNLQEQIDAITSASDVFDVVGTYAQLQAYDKSTVPLNDIIKVLQDSTHNDAATYYRLVETSGATEWQYLGQEGPYYTKSEIDTDFALKSQLPDIATTQQVGLVKPDGSTTFVGQDGTISVGNNIAAALPLFSHLWFDHTINNASYLLANNFSWQSGAVYTQGYQHLVDDIAGKTAQTETVGSYTITFYLADDGHKIVLADQETTVYNIFAEIGTAGYYILDTANTRFKLPRDTHGHGQLVKSYHNGASYYRIYEDGYCEQGNERGAIAIDSTLSVSLVINFIDENYLVFDTALGNGITGDARSNPMVQVGKTASGFVLLQDTYADQGGMWHACGYVSTPANPYRTLYQYLYFYVGNFSQSATEQTAGLNTELFNNKMDRDGNNATEPLVHFSDFEAFKNLILKEVSNMLGRIDWANGITGIDIKHTSSQENTYTCPSDGYILATSLGNGIVATRPLAINHIAVATGSGSSTLACLGNLIAVSEGDLISIEGNAANYATAVINFYPQKQIEESAS